MKIKDVTESNSLVTVGLFTVTGIRIYGEVTKITAPRNKRRSFVMTFGEKLKEARKNAGLS